MSEELAKFFPEEKEFEKETKETREKALFFEIFQKMKQIAKETKYAEKYQSMNRPQRRKFNKLIEKTRIKPLRDQLIKKNPDMAETICALVNLDRSCEWQYLTTHLLAENTDKNFAKEFWYRYKQIGKIFHPQESSETWKKGVIGQVGVFKALEKLGLRPKLASPSQDALEGIDIFALREIEEGKENFALPIQVKYGVFMSRRSKRPLSEVKIIPEERICFPSINIESEQSQTHVFSDALETNAHIEQDVESRAKEVGKTVKSLKIVCPVGSFDEETGEPTEKFLAQLEARIKKYFK